MELEHELTEQSALKNLGWPALAAAVANGVCRVVALCGMVVLVVAMSQVLHGEGVWAEVGQWLDGDHSILRIVALLGFAVLIGVLLLAPLVAFTSTWWRWLLLISPFVLMQALYLLWTRSTGEALGQLHAASWFVPMFIATPILLLIGLATSEPAARWHGERSRLKADAQVAELTARSESRIRKLRTPPVRGRPGLSQEGLDKFGDRALQGTLGERRTAAIIDEWAHNSDSVTVFHGLQFPGSEVADVDHAVVRGTRVALLDSKNWSPGRYSFDSHGHVLRDGPRSRVATCTWPMQYAPTSSRGPSTAQM